jgi:hypothetical protein
MNEVLHANIFFVIASVATVVFSVILCFVLFQVFKIVKALRAIIERVESASEVVAQDITDLRASLKTGGVVSRIVSFILGAAGDSARRKRSRK